MSYIKENFLLKNKTAEKLYFDYAAKMPIFDYHCHLSEYQIYEDKEFDNVFDVWLSGDHYKWRLMRNYGVDEEYITGSKSPKEKFIAYCETLGTAFGNPLYHWSQTELEFYFNCKHEINKENAEKIWDECNAYIKENHITPSKLIESSNVKALFTTNEIFDDLAIFGKLAEKYHNFKVLPAFRADKIMNIDAPKYNEFVDKLGNVSSLDELEARIEERLQNFIKVGCLASDISVEKVELVPERKAVAKIFKKRRSGKDISLKDADTFKAYLTYFLLKLYGKYGIKSELHMGAMRNNNVNMLAKLGLDTGFDSISDENSIKNLSRLLDRLNVENSLPPMIFFNLNQKMNHEIMTLIGCFQDSSMRGKMQFGPAWWFLDNKVGMEKHLKDLTSTGHIGAFVGMLTDSRSLLSYPRHLYFRRILCSYFGKMMERGEMTNDINLVGKVVEDISFNNSVNYFGLKLD